MRKSCLKRVVLYVMMGMILIMLCACRFYNGPTKELGKLTIRLDSEGKRAMAVEWNWSGDPEDTLIEIPDTDGDKVLIDRLGGPIGSNAPVTAFRVATNCDELYQGEDVSKYDFDVSFDTVTFTLKLGKNISSITCVHGNTNSKSNQYIAVKNDDGSVTFYNVLFRVECSDENKTFYSKDGKLYLKKDDSLDSSLRYA